MIILFDHGLCARKQKTLKNRIEKTKTAFEQLSDKLNRYKLKTQDAIDKACLAILKKHHTESFFSYRIINDPITIYKNKHRGRPSNKVKPEQMAVIQDHFRVELTLDQTALDRAQLHCGYYLEHTLLSRTRDINMDKYIDTDRDGITDIDDTDDDNDGVIDSEDGFPKDQYES